MLKNIVLKIILVLGISLTVLSCDYLLDNYLVPGNDGIIEVTEVTSNSIAIEWESARSASGGFEDSFYNLYLTSDDVDEDSIFNDNYYIGETEHDRSWTFSNLQPDTTYYFNIYAESEINEERDCKYKMGYAKTSK